MSDEMHSVMWEGDWSTLADEVCAGDGQLEIWDQTVGCPVCGQNLWNIPMTDEQWPTWSADRPESGNWIRPYPEGHNPYSVYVRLFNRRHPQPLKDEP